MQFKQMRQETHFIGSQAAKSAATKPAEPCGGKKKKLSSLGESKRMAWAFLDRCHSNNGNQCKPMIRYQFRCITDNRLVVRE